MIDAARALATNRAGWDRVAPRVYGETALPEYGPLAPTEASLALLDGESQRRVLELGCGSGHSLRYLAERGAQELWGHRPPGDDGPCRAVSLPGRPPTHASVRR